MVYVVLKNLLFRKQILERPNHEEARKGLDDWFVTQKHDQVVQFTVPLYWEEILQYKDDIQPAIADTVSSVTTVYNTINNNYIVGNHNTLGSTITN